MPTFGAAVGCITSGGHAHPLGKSMAMAHVAAGQAAPGTEPEVEIPGKSCKAVVQAGAVCDAGDSGMRA